MDQNKPISLAEMNRIIAEIDRVKLTPLEVAQARIDAHDRFFPYLSQEEYDSLRFTHVDGEWRVDFADPKDEAPK